MRRRIGRPLGKGLAGSAGVPRFDCTASEHEGAESVGTGGLMVRVAATERQEVHDARW